MSSLKDHVRGIDDFFDRGRCLQTLACALAVSLCVMPAKANTFESEEGFSEGLIQLSSPEAGLLADSSSDSTLGLGSVDLGSSLDFLKAYEDSKTGPRYHSPLLTEGVFPYQWNPVAGIIAATMTLAVKSLKETGKIDWEGIQFLLNSTDFYAGLIGEFAPQASTKTAGLLVRVIKKAIGKGAKPGQLPPLQQAGAMQTIKNIAASVTALASVTVGYETFSQFWKYATKDIPEARTMTGFFKADESVRRRVWLNLLYHAVIDKNLQKKVIDSIYYYRIYTFEFIAMNVGLYVGAQLGTYMAKKYAPGNVWAERLSAVGGSVALGTLVQLIPDSWKSAANERMLRWKISDNEDRLKSALSAVSGGVRDLVYPEKENEGVGSYWMKGFDLGADIERVFRASEVLTTLRIQYAGTQEGLVEPLDAALEVYSDVANVFELERDRLTTEAPSELSKRIEEWVRQKKTPEEIQRLSIREFKADPKRVYYRILLDEAAERAKENVKEIEDFQFTKAKFQEAAEEHPGTDPN